MASEKNVAPATETIVEDVSAVAPAKKSPKAKSELGIPEDHIITWVPFSCDEQTHDTLTKAAKSLGYNKKYDIFVDMLKKSVAANWENLQAEADKYVPSTKEKTEGTGTRAPRKKIEEMTEEEVDKALEAAQKQQKQSAERASALLAAARARKAAAANTPAE